MRIRLPGNYLPLTGGTLTGNLFFGTNSLVFIGGRIYEEGAAALAFRNLLDTAYYPVKLSDARLSGSVIMDSTPGNIGSASQDGYVVTLRVRDTGVGLANVARLVGAALAYLELTRPATCLPQEYLATLVEGQFGYHSTSKRMWYKDNAGIKPIPTLVAAASANLRNSNDASKATASTTYVKVKEIKLVEPLAGVRIAFNANETEAAGTGYARIYKNGVAVGTERNFGASQTFTEDLTGFVAGDLLQIYAHGTAGTNVNVYFLRLYYDLSIVPTAVSAANQDP